MPTCVSVNNAYMAKSLIYMSYYRLIILLIAEFTIYNPAAELLDPFIARIIMLCRIFFLRSEIGSMNIFPALT